MVLAPPNSSEPGLSMRTCRPGQLEVVADFYRYTIRGLFCRFYPNACSVLNSTPTALPCAMPTALQLPFFSHLGFSFSYIVALVHPVHFPIELRSIKRNSVCGLTAMERYLRGFLPRQVFNSPRFSHRRRPQVGCPEGR